jgi:hypothetical protein
LLSDHAPGCGGVAVFLSVVMDLDVPFLADIDR